VSGRSGEPAGSLLAITATAFFASAAILVRFAGQVPPAALAADRLLIGAAFVALGGLVTRTPMGIRPREIAPLAGIGVIAAIHFMAYILALGRTSIAHTLVLVNLSPVFVAVLSPRWLGESLSRGRFAGIGLSLLGLAVMVGFEPRTTASSLSGDLLALLSGLSYAVYSLAGRSVRGRHPLFRYTFWVYLLAALVLLPVGRPWSRASAINGPTLVAVILLGLLPTGLGHTLYNAALRRTTAATANLIATQEVTGGILLGYFFFGETLSAAAVVGGLLALAGVAFVVISGQVSIVRQAGGNPPNPANTTEEKRGSGVR
jgi:drug/metabolite transporter (DMT)-like permease